MILKYIFIFLFSVSYENCYYIFFNLIIMKVFVIKWIFLGCKKLFVIEVGCL